MFPFSHLARSSRAIAFLLCGATLVALSLPASAATIELAAGLDGQQANAGAGTGSSATGVVNIMLDDVTNQMTWSASFGGLGGNFAIAHFHGPASANQNGGVQVGVSFTLDGDLRGGTGGGVVVLSAQQAADLTSGLWYLNIHSQVQPGGEIRGNLSIVPEPSTALLLAGGLACMARGRRSRR